VILARALGRAAAWATLLSGCATATLGPGDTGPYLAGRLSVRVDANPVRAVTAAFELRGDARAGVLVLTSPLGATMAEARWSPESTVLTAPGTRTTYADLDDLAAQALGERLPMAALFEWLRGRPWAGAPSQALGVDQSGFLQLGWQVRLDRFADGVVEAQRDAPPPVTVRARLDRPAP
jgi:outer membrane lipoprotein LolB